MPRPPRPPSSGTKSQGWDPVAKWYDKLVGEHGSDYHRNVIIPAAMRILDPKAGESVIDICCGQGVLINPLLEKGVAKVTGIDASVRLVESAKSRFVGDHRVTLLVGDVCRTAKWADATHDAATCVMAIHDVADIDGLFVNLTKSIRHHGRAVIVFMHPCFRIPRQSHWGWDADQKIQYRRLDRYSLDLEIPITTHPGRSTGEQTIFYHRSLAKLLTAMGKAGLAVTGCEELHSHRRSQATGPFSKAEHAAAEEFPLFMALKAIRVA